MNSFQRTQTGVVGADTEEVLRLHLNENPYGCSLLVQESLSIHDSFAQRPGPLSGTLLRALAKYCGRQTGDIYLANTPEELMLRVLSVCLEPGEQLLAYAPHPKMIEDVARAARIDVLAVPRSRDGAISATAAIQRGDESGRTVYIGSPNDPTGDVVPPLEVVALLHAGLTVIVDETYAEFTDKTLTILGREFPGLISLRSFAPWAGLWGVPVSYALAQSDLVAKLDAFSPQETLSSASRIAAGASLDDSTLLLNRVKHLRLERARLYRRLRKLNFLQPSHSHGPFVPCEVTRGTPEKVCALLETQEGVLLHNCSEDGLAGFIRVSVGTPEQTDQLVGALCRISVQL